MQREMQNYKETKENGPLKWQPEKPAIWGRIGTNTPHDGGGAGLQPAVFLCLQLEGLGVVIETRVLTRVRGTKPPKMKMINKDDGIQWFQVTAMSTY